MLCPGRRLSPSGCEGSVPASYFILLSLLIPRGFCISALAPRFTSRLLVSVNVCFMCLHIILRSMAQDQASAGLVSLLNEFSSLLRGFRGGVVYRMAMQRRLVAAIATAYSAAPTAERTDAICFLAAADESVDHPRGTRSVVEALLAASTTLPGGPIFPITLRADLLRLLSRPGSHEVFNAQTLSRLEHLETVLRWLFLRQSAIRVRRLSVVEPEALLSFLQRIEAVHPFSSRSELERRLGQDAGRAAFGLFFAGMPDTPLVVVYVAIGCEHNPPASVASLLNGVWGSSERTVPTTACFYSITNCVDGLQGLQLGSYLIFLAMEELRHTYPSLSSFVTLSPAPLFGSWLRRRLSDLERPLQPQDARFVRELDQFVTSASALPEADARSREAACSPWLRQQLTLHAAMYVLFERRRTNEFMPSYIDSRTRFPPSKCVDPVANFHVANGGLVDRVLCCADLSSRGLATSFSCMVNYRYDAEFLSGRAPAWRYSSLGVLSSYRLARLFLPGDSFVHAIASDVCDDDLRVSPVFARTCHAGETLAQPV